MKNTLEYIEELEAAIIDLIDGNFEKDIQSQIVAESD